MTSAGFRARITDIWQRFANGDLPQDTRDGIMTNL
jgi:hypothetical protein